MFGRRLTKGGKAFEVDESLGPLGRALLFGNSKHTLQREVFVHELVECAYHVGYDAGVAHLLPLVRKMASDSEVTVRQALAGRFGDLAGFLIQSDPESGYEHVVGDILPAISTLLAEKTPNVRQAAADALVTLASHLRVGERQHHVLMAAVTLSQNNEDEDARSTAAQLLSGLAETLGSELCQVFVGVELVTLCEDPSFRVRKATASGFAEICRVVGDHYSLQTLIPAFGKLVRDKNWGVRQAAAESLVGLAMSLSVEKRTDAFVPLMSALLRDSSRFVKISASQQLGYFIGSLEHRSRVPDFLVSQYVEMIEPTNVNPDATDLRYHCAYTFSAVVQAMGADAWASLQSSFASLCRDRQDKTRQAMAASIHVVARVVGCEGTETGVLPLFEALLQDSADDVRSMALCSLAGVLRFVPSLAAKESLLRLLQAGVGRGRVRMRHLIASQLSAVCETMSSAQHSDKNESLSGLRDLVWSIVLPLFLQLCKDDSTEVRNETARVTALLLRVLAPDVFAEHAAMGTVDGSSGCTAELEPLPPSISRLVKHFVRSFARGKNFRSRQCYIRMCNAIIRESPPHTFTNFFLRPLSRLATDPVPNVRLAWVNMLLPHLRPRCRLCQSRTLSMAASRMAASDSDAEIRRILSSVKLGKPEGDEVGQGFEGGTGDSSECSSTGLSDDDDDDDGTPDVWDSGIVGSTNLSAPPSPCSDRGDTERSQVFLDSSVTDSVAGEGRFIASLGCLGVAAPTALKVSSGGDAELEEADAPAPRSTSRAQDSPPSSPPGSPLSTTIVSEHRVPTHGHRGGHVADVEEMHEDRMGCPVEQVVKEEPSSDPARNTWNMDVGLKVFDALEAVHKDDGLGSLLDLESTTANAGPERAENFSRVSVHQENRLEAKRAVNEEPISDPARSALHKDVRPEVFDATEAAHNDDGLGSLCGLETSTAVAGPECAEQLSGVLMQKQNMLNYPDSGFEVQQHSSHSRLSEATTTTTNSFQGALADSAFLTSGCMSDAKAGVVASMGEPSEPADTPLSSSV